MRAHLLGLIAAAAAGYFTYDFFASDFGEARVHVLLALTYDAFGAWGPTAMMAFVGYVFVYFVAAGLLGDIGRD